MQLLLRNGANVNASWLVPEVGVVLTPISLAAFAGTLGVVSMLIEAGASINSKDKVRFKEIPNKEISIVFYQIW